MDQYIQAVVESPKGGTQKFDYDAKTGSLMLAKQLPIGMSFPFDFGFLPGTIGEDGDPLDVMVLGDSPTFSGCRVNCRIIGSLVCEQTERDGKKMRNDRYIAVCNVSGQYEKIAKIGQLPRSLLEELENFFVSYNELAGKTFRVLSRIGPVRSLAQIARQRTNDIPRAKLEIYLPLADQNGRKFPRADYQQLEGELTARFGGLTSYSRVPVEGFWQPGDKCTSQPMLIYELLLSEIDLAYWTRMKARLEKQFRQREVLITHGSASKI